MDINSSDFKIDRIKEKENQFTLTIYEIIIISRRGKCLKIILNVI